MTRVDAVFDAFDLEIGALVYLFYYLLFFGLLFLVTGLLFSHKVKKRINNESV
jgi:hypothetical protein